MLGTSTTYRGIVKYPLVTFTKMRSKFIVRIQPYINKNTDECVMYPIVNQDGYGAMQCSLPGKKKGRYLAHRLVYELEHDIILTPEQLILHSCDNPGCVNPRHLRVGTHEENVKDRQSRGRQAKGKDNGRYKTGYQSKFDPVEKPETPFEGLCGRTFTREQVLELRKAIAKRGSTTLKELSDILGVKYHNIVDLANNRTYQNVI